MHFTPMRISNFWPLWFVMLIKWWGVESRLQWKVEWKLANMLPNYCLHFLVTKLVLIFNIVDCIISIHHYHCWDWLNILCCNEYIYSLILFTWLCKKKHRLQNSLVWFGFQSDLTHRNCNEWFCIYVSAKEIFKDADVIHIFWV